MRVYHLSGNARRTVDLRDYESVITEAVTTVMSKKDVTVIVDKDSYTVSPTPSQGEAMAILISRDGDFSGVVRIIKNLGKTVELVLFEDCKNNARDLTDCVDNVTLIHRHDYPELAVHTGA